MANTFYLNSTLKAVSINNNTNWKVIEANRFLEYTATSITVIPSRVFDLGWNEFTIYPAADTIVLDTVTKAPNFYTVAALMDILQNEVFLKANAVTGTSTGGTFLVDANNLSDVPSKPTARTNLGLGTLATQNGTFSGTSSGTNTGDETAVGIKTKLETLTGASRLDASAIQNLSAPAGADIEISDITKGFILLDANGSGHRARLRFYRTDDTNWSAEIVQIS